MSFKKNILSLSLCLLLCSLSACSNSDETPESHTEEEMQEQLPVGTGVQSAARVQAAIHSEASTMSGKIIGTIPVGAAVEIVSEEGQWTQVIYKNQSGYVYSQFLSASAYQPDLITVGSIHTLTNAELDKIAASYDGSNLGFGAPGNRLDEHNRDMDALDLENKLSEFNPIFFGDTSSNSIYLTFSCGWENSPNTTTILNVLAEHNIKAVFYINYEYASSNPDLVRRMINEGHEIGNHGYSHPDDGMPSLSLSAQMNDAIRMQSYIYDNFGYTMKKYNFSSSAWSYQSVALMDAMGYQVCFYSCNYADYDVNQQKEPAEVLEMLTSRLAPGCVYYLHPVSTSNTNALEDFILNAKNRGYRFGTLY